MYKGGKEYRRFVAAFERIVEATSLFGAGAISAKLKVVQRSRFNFPRESQIWYNGEPDQTGSLRIWRQ